VWSSGIRQPPWYGLNRNIKAMGVQEFCGPTVCWHTLTVFGSFVGFWLMNWCGITSSLYASTDVNKMNDFRTITVVLVQKEGFQRKSRVNKTLKSHADHMPWLSSLNTMERLSDLNREPSHILSLIGANLLNTRYVLLRIPALSQDGNSGNRLAYQNVSSTHFHDHRHLHQHDSISLSW
jgi:hypothetical protein